MVVEDYVLKGHNAYAAECWDEGDEAFERDRIGSWPINQPSKLAEQTILSGETVNYRTDPPGLYDHCEIINTGVRSSL